MARCRTRAPAAKSITRSAGPKRSALSRSGCSMMSPTGMSVTMMVASTPSSRFTVAVVRIHAAIASTHVSLMSSLGWKSRLPRLIQRRAPLRGRTIESGTNGTRMNTRNAALTANMNHAQRRIQRQCCAPTKDAISMPTIRNPNCRCASAGSVVAMAVMPTRLSPSAAATGSHAQCDQTRAAVRVSVARSRRSPRASELSTRMLIRRLPWVPLRLRRWAAQPCAPDANAGRLRGSPPR